MGNNRTKDGRAHTDVQAIQLLLSTCFLCEWDATSPTVQLHWGGVTHIN